MQKFYSLLVDGRWHHARETQLAPIPHDDPAFTAALDGRMYDDFDDGDLFGGDAGYMRDGVTGIGENDGPVRKPYRGWSIPPGTPAPPVDEEEIEEVGWDDFEDAL